MATTTTNFGFDVPTSSDLVKNGATQIALLGQDIDTFLAGGVGFAAGKTKVINGDFVVNQRQFTSTTTSGAFVADRWQIANTDGTVTSSLQTFTPGAAPVAGYEGSTYFRQITTGQTLSSAAAYVRTYIEDVRVLAGQTATVSFWAKAASGTPKIAVQLTQNFGSGGSASVDTALGQPTLSTSWQRYSVTFTVPSITGKTIGTSSHLRLFFWTSAGSNFNSTTGSLGIQSNTFDIWGAQLEAGSTASPFQTATGTLQGELAACQRYYWRSSADATVNTAHFGIGNAYATTNVAIQVILPITMRIPPTTLDSSGLQASDVVTNLAVSSPAISSNRTTNTQVLLTGTVSGATQYRTYFLTATGSTSYLGLSAEL
jgi:hypothetical protein